MTAHRWISAPLTAVAATLLLVASGCETTWPVDSYEPAGAGLSGKRTFAWTGGELGTVAAVDPTVAASTDIHIRDAVVAGFVRKGYTQVADAKSADMLVSYQVVGSRRVVTSERPRFNAPLPDDVLMQSNPQPPAASELPRERTVRDGTVVVFVDESGNGAPVVARRDHGGDTAYVRRKRDPHGGGDGDCHRGEISAASRRPLRVGLSADPRDWVSDRSSRARCPAST